MEGSVSSYRSIFRAVSILKSFTPSDLELSSAEISRRVGLHRATTHRILTALAECGMLRRIGKTGKYAIGPLLYQMGTLYLDTVDVFKASKPIMETIRDLTREDIVMGMLDRGNVVLIMKEESNLDFRIGRHVGESIPAYASSMGKALLSELTDAELDLLYPEEKLEPVTEKTVTRKAELRSILRDVGKSGVAYDQESGRIGVEGVASVVRDASGKAIVALCISLPIFRANPERRQKLAKLVTMSASLISSHLGYRDSDKPVPDIREIQSWWVKQQL
jgi:DNA-binding IclR family transcriptional regulator